MPRSPKGVLFVCPNCHRLVDPRKPNAVLSAATKAWQHKDCPRRGAPLAPPEAPSSYPQRDRHPAGEA
jgi:hypothetical protein